MSSRFLNDVFNLERAGKKVRIACFKPLLITGNPKGEILWQPEARG